MQHAMKVFEDPQNEQFRLIDRDGEPWFVLTDVCKRLAIINAADAASRLDDDEKDTVGITDTIGRSRPMTVINESGLYSLILRSSKPEAKAFKKWVTSEVLPSIRKTGSYSGGAKIPAFIKRFNANWNRVDVGYFSVLGELTVRVYGRLESLGYIMKDRAPDGREIRPDVSVGRLFSKWLKDEHPDVANEFSYYIHWSPEWEGEARQYPNSLWVLFIEFVDEVWIPEHAENYFKKRDAGALPYLTGMLPGPHMARGGRTRRVT